MLTLYFKEHMHTGLRFFVGCALHNGVSRKNSNALAPRTGRLLQKKTLFLQGFLFEVSPPTGRNQRTATVPFLRHIRNLLLVDLLKTHFKGGYSIGVCFRRVKRFSVKPRRSSACFAVRGYRSQTFSFAPVHTYTYGSVIHTEIHIETYT